jgi:hypothetical protein
LSLFVAEPASGGSNGFWLMPSILTEAGAERAV